MELMEATKKEERNTESLKGQLMVLSEVENSDTGQLTMTKLSQTDLVDKFETLFKKLDDESTHLVNSLVKAGGGRITRAKTEKLVKSAQVRVLDMRKEVQLLHEIKDVQDEPRIMFIIFRVQSVVIRDMEEIMESIASKGEMGNPSTPEDRKTVGVTETELPVEVETNRPRTKASIEDLGGNTDKTKTSAEEGNSVNIGIKSLPSVAKVAGLRTIEKQRFMISSRAIVKLSADEIEDMAQRAKNAYDALNLLIDLKQKQSNVMDTRYARDQAEQTVKQGKTIMVFTIVTIIFLPLSFMAAFFAIDISEFKRVGEDKLSLGYVSEIIFPISAFIIASLICIAFSIDSFEWWWTSKISWWTSKTSWFKRQKAMHEDKPGQIPTTDLERGDQSTV